MDESEFELKFEAVLIEAEDWWESAEPEEKVIAYLNYKKFQEIEEEEVKNE